MRKALIPTAFVAIALVTGGAVAQDNTGKRFEVALEGKQEVGGGDPDGRGTASLRINPGLGQLCYTLSVSGIAPAAAAHIHEAPAGVNGGVVVHLNAPTSGSSSGCSDIGRELALEILRTPEDYYVNVHNGPFPGGALRGQIAF
jgi:hypothetical protein